MTDLSLGIIEVCGLPAALEAVDVAQKTADVKLIGYETTDGMGMVSIKVEGNVSAVQAAVSAAKVAAGKLTSVVAVSVIPRPSSQLDLIVDTDVTVGRGASPSARPLEAKPHPRSHKPEDIAHRDDEPAETKGCEPHAEEAEPEGTPSDAEPQPSAPDAHKPEEQAAPQAPAPRKARPASKSKTRKRSAHQVRADGTDNTKKHH